MLLTLPGIDAPTNTGCLHPVLDNLQIVGGDTKAAADDGLLQQIEHRAGGKARAGQGQQRQHGARRRIHLAARPPADRKGNRAIARRVAEHRVDQRSGRLQVGRYHQNVARSRWIRPGEHRQQLVLENFQLPRQRMADMDFDAAIVGCRGHAAGGDFDQIEDCVLQLRQHAGRWVGDKACIVDLRLFDDFEQQIDIRLSLLAPARQQAVSTLVMVGFTLRGEVTEAALIDDFEPVFLAGIEHVQMQVNPAPQLPKQVEIKRWNGRQTKQVGDFGQAETLRRVMPKRFDFAHEGAGRVFPRHPQLRGDRAPKRRLPSLVGLGRVAGVRQRYVLAGRPGGEPVRSIGHVLLEQRRDLAGKIEANHRVRLPQPAFQAREFGYEGGIVEELKNPPGQQRRSEWRIRRNVGYHFANLPPQPLRQEGEFNIGANAVAIGDRKCQVAAERATRHDDLLGGER